MGRTKKDAAVAVEAEGSVDLIPPVVEAGDEGVKKLGRPAGKRKAKEVTSENSPPKRTLRSNSKTSLVVAPVEKEVVAEEKKGRKAPAKAKKLEEVTSDSDASEKTDAPAVNGNGLLKSKTENGVASADDIEKETAAPEKGAKGRKKNEKTAPAVNGETLKETEKKETKQTDDSETVKNDNADKEKSKPVKATNGKGKKKAESKTVQADSEEVTPEPEAEVNGKEEEVKDEKAATGKGKKKAEKKDEEVVAPKKTKKEAPAKPAKGAKGVEAEETKEEKESKPAAAETKKPAAKGKSAKAAKEVAIEHWNAERVKNILAPFCSPSVVFSINTKSTPPRRGAFEITVVNDDDEEQVMWSGLKLGPPRKEKFPSDEKLEELAATFFSD